MEENKNVLQEDRREYRRKRRIRNQVICYGVIMILIAALGVGIVNGVKAVKTFNDQKQEELESSQEKLEDLLATEETLEEPESSQVVEDEPPVVELTPEQKLDEIVNAGIEVMSLEDKVAGLFITTPEAITGVKTAVAAGDSTKEALTKYAVGGIIYSKKNMKSAAKFATMVENTSLYAKYPLFLAVQEEGGSVSSLASAGIADKVDSAQSIGASGDVTQAYNAGTKLGANLNMYALNLNFAPLADLCSVDGSIMEKRSYGSDATVVASMVTAMLQGMSQHGIDACVGHFPGAGATTKDTNKGLASTNRSGDEFRQNEFQVFRAAIENGAAMIMVSHMSAPALSGDDTPCSMSSVVITDILRGELGYDGVIISQAMSQKAISDYYASDEAAIASLKAGCDMILDPEDFKLAYEGVLQAVRDGVISEERVNDSLRRIYRVKYADKITGLQ